MALAKLQIVFELDGVTHVVDGMQAVEASANRMDKTVTTATGKMAQSTGSVTTATGKMAAEHARHMAQVADNYNSAAQGVTRLGEQVRHTHGGMTAWEKTLWENQMRLMNVSMAIAMVTAGMVAMAKAADTQTNIASKIRLVTESATEQVAVNQRLFDLAQGTRSQNEATVDLYTRLARFTKELSLTQGELYRVTESVNKSITISGGSAASAQAAIIQFNQAMASGTLRGEELNSVMEQAPRLAEAIAKGLGVAIGDLRQLGESGELTSEQVVRALLSQSNAIDAEYAKMTVTVAQAGTIFTNALGRYIGQADQMTGASSRIAAGIVYLADNIHSLDGVLNGVVITGQALLPILGDILTITKGIVQAAGEIPSVLGQAPGIVTALGVAAYYAVGGVAGLTAGFTALTATITASMATNPVGWAMGIGAAFYLAAKPAVKALDEIIYKYTQLNLTGEAMYNAEMKRAAEADKAWENAKQKALWKYKEGGILPSTGMQKELGITGSDVKPPAPEDTEAIKRYNDYIKEYNRLQDERVKLQIQENPYLTELGKKLAEVQYRYKDLIKQFPEHRAELLRNMELDKQNVQNLNEQKQAYDALKGSIKALEQENALQGDATSQGMKWNLRNQDYLGWKPKNQKPSLFGPSSSSFNQSSEDWGAIEKLIQELNGSAEVEKFLEQLRQVEQWAERFPEKADEAARAALALKDKLQSITGLDKLIRENADLSDSLIDDPYARQMAQIKTRYEFERAEIEKTLYLAEAGKEKEAELIKRLSLLDQEYQKDSAKVAGDSYRAQLSMAAEYTGMAGNFFTALAGTMDTSSRSGFESARSMQLAGAIVSTAAAVMLQMSGGDPYTAWARAAAAAAMGAVQIYTIASTQYGGGATIPSVSGGSFSGGSGGGSGSVGSKIGAPITSIQDQQTQESMRNLAASMDNASLAIGRVADGLTRIEGIFESGQAKLAVGAAPNLFTSLYQGQGWSIGKDVKDMFGDVLGTNLPQRLLSDFFGWGSKWERMGAGISLGISNGSAVGMNYEQWKKDGGWFGSDKHETRYSAIDGGFLGVMDRYVTKIEATINRSAVVMGTSADLSKVNVPWTNIATAGRSTDDIAKDLEAWLQRVGDEMAKNVEGLQDFSYYGENAYDALVRLSTSLQGVNEQLELVGATLIESTLRGADAAYRLADSFGGLDKLTDAVGVYFETMFTDAEKQTMTAVQAQRQMTTAFAEMGLAVPGTRDQFVNLVNSLDLTTERGAAAFGALMNIAEASGIVYDQAEEFARNTRTMTNDLHTRLLRLDGQTAAADIYELMISQEDELQAARDKGLDVTQLMIVQQRELAKAVEDAGKSIADTQQQLIDAQRKLVETSKSALLDLIGTQETILNTIRTIQSGPLAMLSPEAAYQQTRAQFANSDLKSLSANATAFLEASKAIYASGSQFVADREWVLSILGNAAGIGDNPTLDLATAQLDVLKEIKTLIGAGNVEQLAALQQQLSLVGATGTQQIAMLGNQLQAITDGNLAQLAAMQQQMGLTDTTAGQQLAILKNQLQAMSDGNVEQLTALQRQLSLTDSTSTDQQALLRNQLQATVGGNLEQLATLQQQLNLIDTTGLQQETLLRNQLQTMISGNIEQLTALQQQLNLTDATGVQQLNLLRTQLQTMNNGNSEQMTLLKEQIGGSAGLTSLLTTYLQSNQSALEASQKAAEAAKAAAEAEIAALKEQAAKAAAQANWQAGVDVLKSTLTAQQTDFNNRVASPKTYIDEMVNALKNGQYIAKYDVYNESTGKMGVDNKLTQEDVRLFMQAWFPADNYQFAYNQLEDGNVLFIWDILKSMGIYSNYRQDFVNQMTALPSFDVGTAGLPADMPLYGHKDEKIIDPVASRYLDKYGIKVTGGGDGKVAAALAETNARLARVEQHLEAANRQRGAIGTKMIEANEKQAKSAEVAASKARMVASA